MMRTSDLNSDAGSAPAETDSRSARVRTPWRRVRLAAGIAVGVLILLVAVDFATSSPRLCASCHELTPRVDSWSESAHSAVACVECHQTPREWYELPIELVDRGRLLAHDTLAHLEGDFEDPVETATAGAEPVSDDVCLQCHSPNREATSGYRILIDHVEHAERNGSCVSCHVRTAHPLETRGRALSLMTQCFTCHDSAEEAEASGECGLCHPADYELLPASHETEWRASHGDVARYDLPQCEMCHVESFCSDCHGLEMPHPSGWDQEPNGHVTAVEQDRVVCTPCHGEQPDSCTMCHHTAYNPARGTWLGQHFLTVRQSGYTNCEDCHTLAFCAYCHVGPPKI